MQLSDFRQMAAAPRPHPLPTQAFPACAKERLITYKMAPVCGTLNVYLLHNKHSTREVSRCAYKCNIILNSVRQHYFITQCNYIGYMFRL